MPHQFNNIQTLKNCLERFCCFCGREVYHLKLVHCCYFSNDEDCNSCPMRETPLEKKGACIPYPLLVSLRSTYPLSLYQQGTREEIPMHAQKALFYAKKGRDTNSFAYFSFPFEKITPVSLVKETRYRKRVVFFSFVCEAVFPFSLLSIEGIQIFFVSAKGYLVSLPL